MVLVLIITFLVIVVGLYLVSTMQEMQLKKAEEAVEHGDLDVALSIFMNNLKKNPSNVETLWHLGNINEEKGNFLEAIGYYNQIINIGEKNALYSEYELFKRTGLLYHEIKRDKDALDYLLQALQILPTSKEPPYYIAMILLAQKQYYRALSYFEKALVHYAQNGEFRKYYGLCNLQTESFQSALQHFEEADILAPGDCQTKFLLSYTYLRSGAHIKAREVMEDVINNHRTALTSPELFTAIKVLFLSYCEDKNYEVARDLHQKMENLAANQKDTRMIEDGHMAFIYMRYLQGYYDLCLERLEQILQINVDTTGMNEEEIEKIKQNNSHLYEMFSVMAQYKQEKERARLLQEAGKKVEVEFNILENKAREVFKELQRTMEDWKNHFISHVSIAEFFLPAAEENFDPTILLDKYSEESMKVIKKKLGQSEKAKPARKETFKSLGVDPNDPCQSLKYMDFPSFLITARELAEHMGYKVLNQAVKLDAVAYSEGQGTDLLCEEKFNKDARVLFIVRRWREPMGYILITNLKGRMAEFKAKRIILVSTAPLSDEARGVVEKDPAIEFYSCESITQYLMG